MRSFKVRARQAQRPSLLGLCRTAAELHTSEARVKRPHGAKSSSRLRATSGASPRVPPPPNFVLYVIIRRSLLYAITTEILLRFHRCVPRGTLKTLKQKSRCKKRLFNNRTAIIKAASMYVLYDTYKNCYYSTCARIHDFAQNGKPRYC